jgi:Uri superfamily endonuclease
VGQESQAGTYLLHIHLNSEITLAFGRFRGGAGFTLPAGGYVYIGSALNPRGGLASRLLRHATRAGGPPHPIRERLLEHFRASGLGPPDLHPPRTKKLHWHVDYLLEQTNAELVGVYVIRVPARWEGAVAQWVAADPATNIIVPGLGANDVRGGTHLLQVLEGRGWWETLGARLEVRVPDFQ